MGWTAPRDWTVGEIVTEAMMDTHIKNNLRYLKGLDGVPTIESGLTIDNTDGDERLLLPLLTTAECVTVLNAEGEVAFDEQTHQMKEYDGTAVRVIISEADVDDTPVNGATTVPVSSNWAYDHLGLLTTAGDIIYATGAGTWVRLGIGTAGQRLRVNAGATAPEWGVTGQTQEIFARALYPIAELSDAGIIINVNGESGTGVIRVPLDYTTLTSVKAILFPTTTGTIDWTVNTSFGADGETYNLHTDSATADGLAVTNITWKEVDISAAFTGIAAGDNIKINFIVDVLTDTESIGLLGFNFKYS